MLSEQHLEDLCLGWFQETGWQCAHGPDIAPDSSMPERTDYRQVVLRERLLTTLGRINPQIPPAALEQAIHVLQTVSEPQMVVRNRSVHQLLLNGVRVEFALGDDKKSDLVRFIDFAQPSHNDFLVVNQFTITGAKQLRRPDMVVFVNGLPLAVVELKNPANEQTDVWDAFNQLQTYKDEVSELFNSNVALVVSDGWTARVGSLTANTERMLPWRTVANEDDRPRVQMELETVVRGFFQPALFLDYVQHFVLFEQDDGTLIKKIAGYHQFHAVREAVRATVIAAQDADKGVLAVCEGLETAVSIAQASNFWAIAACGTAANLINVDIPESVEHLIIFADKDASGAGERAAHELYEREQQVRRCEIALPPCTIPRGAKGIDWLDCLALDSSNIAETLTNIIGRVLCKKL